MRVAAFARGLQSLVQANNRGEGIRELADAMVATINAAPLMSIASRVVQRRVDSLTEGAFGIVAFTVPVGRMWRLIALEHRMGVGGGLPSTEAIEPWRLAIVPPGSPTSISLAWRDTQDGHGANGTTDLVWQPPGGELWLAGGTEIQVSGFVTGAGPLAFDSWVMALYEELTD